MFTSIIFIAFIMIWVVLTGVWKGLAIKCFLKQLIKEKCKYFLH